MIALIPVMAVAIVPNNQIFNAYLVWGDQQFDLVTSQLAAALPKFAINSVCPGWVRTDLGGENARLSVAEGASSVVWLATEAPHSLTGKFIKERREIPW